jgi:hypothetical protein
LIDEFPKVRERTYSANERRGSRSRRDDLKLGTNVLFPSAKVNGELSLAGERLFWKSVILEVIESRAKGRLSIRSTRTETYRSRVQLSRDVEGLSLLHMSALIIFFKFN